jgi:hypothetical protein
VLGAVPLADMLAHAFLLGRANRARLRFDYGAAGDRAAARPSPQPLPI